MKKKVLVGLCVIIMISCCILSNRNLTLSSGNKKVIRGNSIEINAPKEQLLDTSQIILLGEVIEQLPSSYTNPNKDRINEKTGELITNAWETDYLVKVKEVYKGVPYDNKTIRVKTWNRIGLPPLEEKGYIYESDTPEFYLNMGEECIFCLSYSETSTLNTGEFGYEVVYRYQGYFKSKGDNKFKSSKFELNKDTITNDISSSEGYILKKTKSEENSP